MSEMKRLRDGAIDLVELTRFPMSPSFGGVTYFIGMVRNLHDGKEVRAIRYHAHETLAERRLGEIEAEAARLFGAEVHLAHAVGDLVVGDASVLVVATAGHRAESFAACRWAIDTLKRTVPIWKEEQYVNGESGFQQGIPLSSVRQE